MFSKLFKISNFLHTPVTWIILLLVGWFALKNRQGLVFLLTETGFDPSKIKIITNDIDKNPSLKRETGKYVANTRRLREEKRHNLLQSIARQNFVIPLYFSKELSRRRVDVFSKNMHFYYYLNIKFANFIKNFQFLLIHSRSYEIFIKHTYTISR